ncbi:MAG: diaminopimelate decarboxylase, partial [Oscillospiraceae bacterium]
MDLNKNLTVNSEGHLCFAGIDTISLAQEYQTPLYLMDEDYIRKNCEIFKTSIDKYYGSKGLVCYASKAFSCKEMYRIAMEEGIGIDVVSMGELYTAKSVGFPPNMICYHGNNKSYDELVFALEYGVTRIVADSFEELEMLNEIAGKMNIKAQILLRLSPGIDAHTHSFIKTGQIDSKFGFAIELSTAMAAIKKALTLENIKVCGVHCHIGSQIFEIDPFVLAAEVMLDFIYQVKKETGFVIEQMNLGGGFGIRYTDEDSPRNYDEYMKKVSIAVQAKCGTLGISLPFIIIEPGRSIVGPAGITLYTVGSIKKIEGFRTYVAVDGGMTDNIRYALYSSKYDFLIANRANQKRESVVTIAGRCCESGDLLGENVAIQTP